MKVQRLINILNILFSVFLVPSVSEKAGLQPIWLPEGLSESYMSNLLNYEVTLKGMCYWRSAIHGERILYVSLCGKTEWKVAPLSVVPSLPGKSVR